MEQVIQYVSLDIVQLVLDHLSLPDLVNLHDAYLDIPKLSSLCQITGQHRLSSYFANSPQTKISMIIDGERLNYKRFRNELYRQYSTGRHIRARPFRAVISQTRVERNFVGGDQHSRMGTKTQVGKPQMLLREDNIQRLLNERLDEEEMRWWRSDYTFQPGLHGDGSYGPAEIVACGLSLFSSTGNNGLFEKIHLEYDTEDVIIPKTSISEQDAGDNGEHILRTISHHLPLTKLSYHVENMQEGHHGGFDLPLSWAAMLGKKMVCTVVFKESVRQRQDTRKTFYPKGGPMEMLSLELRWDVSLSEDLCRRDVLDFWGQHDEKKENRNMGF